MAFQSKYYFQKQEVMIFHNVLWVLSNIVLLSASFFLLLFTKRKIDFLPLMCCAHMVCGHVWIAKEGASTAVSYMLSIWWCFTHSCLRDVPKIQTPGWKWNWRNRIDVTWIKQKQNRLFHIKASPSSQSVGLQCFETWTNVSLL